MPQRYLRVDDVPAFNVVGLAAEETAEGFGGDEEEDGDDEAELVGDGFGDEAADVWLVRG